MAIGYSFLQAADHSPSQLKLLQSAINRRRGNDGLQGLNIIGAYKTENPNQSVNKVRAALQKMTDDHG